MIRDNAYQPRSDNYINLILKLNTTYTHRHCPPFSLSLLLSLQTLKKSQNLFLNSSKYFVVEVSLLFSSFYSVALKLSNFAHFFQARRKEKNNIQVNAFFTPRKCTLTNIRCTKSKNTKEMLIVSYEFQMFTCVYLCGCAYL